MLTPLTPSTATLRERIRIIFSASDLTSDDVIVVCVDVLDSQFRDFITASDHFASCRQRVSKLVIN